MRGVEPDARALTTRSAEQVVFGSERKLVPRRGVEPLTFAFVARRSVLLSYMGKTR